MLLKTIKVVTKCCYYTLTLLEGCEFASTSILDLRHLVTKGSIKSLP